MLSGDLRIFFEKMACNTVITEEFLKAMQEELRWVEDEKRKRLEDAAIDSTQTPHALILMGKSKMLLEIMNGVEGIIKAKQRGVRIDA